MYTGSKNLHLFFGHQSVGADLLCGLTELKEDIGAPVPELVELTEFECTQSNFTLVHTRVGTNGDPVSKLIAFRQLLDSSKLSTVDAALLKFCYVDVTTLSAARSLVNTYASFMEELTKRHSRLRIVHCTIPLRLLPSGPYAFLRRAMGHQHPQYQANLAREWFNEQLRSEHAGDDLFDLALLESTSRSGQRCMHDIGGDRVPSLAPEWTSDGGHLNECGRKMLATEFFNFLSALGTH